MRWLQRSHCFLHEGSAVPRNGHWVCVCLCTTLYLCVHKHRLGGCAKRVACQCLCKCGCRWIPQNITWTCFIGFVCVFHIYAQPPVEISGAWRGVPVSTITHCCWADSTHCSVAGIWKRISGSSRGVLEFYTHTCTHCPSGCSVSLDLTGETKLTAALQRVGISGVSHSLTHSNTRSLQVAIRGYRPKIIQTCLPSSIIHFLSLKFNFKFSLYSFHALFTVSCSEAFQLVHVSVTIVENKGRDADLTKWNPDEASFSGAMLVWLNCQVWSRTATNDYFFVFISSL